jgi:autotransporter-associated beta strand protein
MGSIFARGGQYSGNGGRIETSGHAIDIDIKAGDASAPHGQGGQWLFDPTFITITSGGNDGTINGSTVTDGSINTLLNAGTGVTISTDSGGNYDLTVNDSVSINKTGGGDALLRLNATRHIVIKNANFASSSNKLNLLFNSDTDKSGDGFISFAGNINSTNGGSIKFGNLVDTASLNGTTANVGGDVYFLRTSAQTISSAGGDISIWGETLVGNTSGLTINSGAGNVRFYGVVNSASQSFTGINYGSSISWITALDQADNVANSYLASISSRLENSLAALSVNYNTAWIGARRDQPGVWRWGAGPLAGQAITYSNWAAGEPNNCCTGSRNDNGFYGENAAQFTGNNGNWNDLFDNGALGQTLSWYVRATSLNSSPLTVTGTGNVTFDKAVGTNKTLTNLSVSGNQVAFNGALQLDSSGGTITNTGNSSVAGAISGTGSLNKAGAGTLTLSGISTYTGATNVNAGTLKITGSIYCDSNCGTGAEFGNVATAITTVNSEGVLELTNWNWAGGLGERHYSANALVVNGGTLRYSGIGTNDIGRGFTVTASGATFESVNTGSSWNFYDGGASNSSYRSIFNNNASLAFTGQGNIGFGQPISGTGVTVTKTSSGNLTLSGNNTYTGATTINTGPFIVENNAPTFSTSGYSGAGSLVVQSAGAAFTSPVVFDKSISSLAGLTIGKTTNTANVSALYSLSVGGPVRIYGGNVFLADNLTSTAAGQLLLQGSGDVTVMGNVSTSGAFSATAGAISSFSMGMNYATSVGSTITANGGVTLSAGTNYLAGNITTVGTGISVTGNVQLANLSATPDANPVTFDSGGGAVT